MMFEYVNKAKRLSYLSRRGYLFLSVLFVIIMSGITYSMDRLNNTYKRAVNASDVHALAKGISKSVVDMETGYRGYRLYKSKEHLEPFYSGVSQYSKYFHTLREKIGDNKAQRTELETINLLVIDWQKQTKNMISHGSDYHSNDSADRKVIIDEIRYRINTIEHLESDKFSAYAEEEIKTKRLIIGMSFFGSFLPLAFAFILSGTAQKLSDEVTDINESLTDEITTRKDLEIKLLKNLAIHGAVLKVSPNPIILMDAQGIIQDFNPAAETLFGYAKNDIVNKEFVEIIVPEASRDLHRTNLVQLLLTKEPVVMGQTLKIDAIKNDGTVFPVEIHIAIVDLNSSFYLVGFVRDLKKPVKKKAPVSRARKNVNA